MREANKVQMQDIAEIREGRAREAAELSHLAGEIASLAQASRLQQQEIVDLRETNKVQKEEIGALGRTEAKSNKEMSELRAQFGREQEATTREIAALGRRLGEEAAARGKFAQELESLKAQFAKEQTKCEEASQQNKREHESLRKQNPAPASASPAKPAPPPKPPAAPQTQFSFTSDPPEKGKMPAGGVIAHLTAKCGGNVHDKGAVEITASGAYAN
jgi:septal ring factor EnvC (AmiA/AmiB activator)